MILKLLISLIFVGAEAQKFTGKVALNCEPWGYSPRFLYAIGITAVVALALFSKDARHRISGLDQRPAEATP